MKKITASILAAFFVLLSPLSAFASTTESAYEVMPLSLYDDEDNLSVTRSVSYGDYHLDSYPFSIPESTPWSLPINERFNNKYLWPAKAIDNDDVISNHINAVRFNLTFTSQNSDFLFDTLLGIDSVFSGLAFGFAVYDWSDGGAGKLYDDYFRYKPIEIEYRAEDITGATISSGRINVNDLDYLSEYAFSLPYYFEPNSLNKEIYSLEFTFYYLLPDIVFSAYNFDNFVATIAFANNNDNYITGDFVGSSGSSTSQDDYNKNVEAELGNIQTGINNVISSVVQMGNQAWQGAQQTVQAVTQMTTELSNVIDQQRQDILDGLGLLGDDLDSSLNNVKTEITNIGSSITNKLESTTESITNKIESTTETITNTIETKVDQVTTAVEHVKESVTEVKNSILDLPNKIKDMLLGLIVPDAETMSSKFSEFSGLLEQKLGVIYQIPMMLFDFFDTIVNAATTPQTSLTLPAFQLPWIDGTTLTVWQPVEYNIIPEGMKVLSDLIQTITSMTVVVLTFNSIKRAYERFLRS